MYIFFGFGSAKIIEISKIWQSCSHVYTATFYEPHQKCSFWFLQVRCAHKSGDVINFTIVACRISSRLKLYKNCKSRLRLAKVIVKNKMSRFFMVHCVVRVQCRCKESSRSLSHLLMSFLFNYGALLILLSPLARAPVVNALVLDNLYEYRQTSYSTKT